MQSRHRASSISDDPLGQVKKKCDACACDRIELISHLDRRGKELPTGICLHCGLVCHMEIPSDEELKAFYAGNYRMEYHGEREPSRRRVMRAWQTGQRILRQLQPFIPRGARVLEIGAGIGCTVKAFELAGYNASGIDPGNDFARYSIEKLHAKLTVCDLLDLPPEPIADVILLIHVIEHFRSPRQALAHIRSLLSPQGYLYIECPNLAAPFAPFSKMFHEAHIHNFTPATLQGLANQVGFEVESLLSPERDRNLQMLLRGDAETLPMVLPNLSLQVLNDLNRAKKTFRYHARPSYMAYRFRQIIGYAWEHLAAEWYVTRLERRCREYASGNGAEAAIVGDHHASRLPPDRIPIYQPNSGSTTKAAA